MNKSLKLLAFLIFSLCAVTSCKKKTEVSGESKNQNISVVNESLQQSMDADELQFDKEKHLVDDELSLLESDFNQAQMELSLLQNQTPEKEFNLKTEKESNEKIVKDSKGKLRLYTYDKEILIPGFDEDSTVIVSANEKKVERNYYDKLNRFYKKEEWNIPDVENAVLVKTSEYKYEQNSFVPVEKIITTDTSRICIAYNENSKPVFSNEYIIVSVDETSEKKDFLKKEISYIYDDQNRLLKEQSNELEYTDPLYEKVKSSFGKTIIYNYANGEEIPGNYKYYENNVLRFEKVYSAIKGNYWEKVYFADGYCVQTIYENNFKKKDIYTYKGISVRETDYE